MKQLQNIGIGIIGMGRAGTIHLRNIERMFENVKVEAISNRSPEAMHRPSSQFGIAKCYTDYRELIADPGVDAVIIATPTASHKEIVLEAASWKKPVLCEKPMASSYEDCIHMNEAAEKNGIPLVMAYIKRFDKNYLAAKKAAERGEIGDVVCVRSHSRGPNKPRQWSYDLNNSKGIINELGSHDIDIMRWFTGSEMSRIFAVAGNYRCKDAEAEYPDFYDTVSVAASFENGSQGLLNACANVGYGYDTQTEILGAKGCIVIGTKEDKGFTLINDGHLSASPVLRSWETVFQDAYRALDEHFINVVRGEEDARVGGYDGMMAMKAVEAVNRSIRTGEIAGL